MQHISSRSSLNKCTDLTIPCINEQCQIVNKEVLDLRQQVSNLKETVLSLENTMKLKDAQLQNMRRDNERLSVELKKQQRCVRNIKQQLDDERFFYQREKDYFNDELQRQKMKSAGGTSTLYQQRMDFENVQTSLEKENRSLKEELTEKTQTTYNLCIKFLRMKYAKDTLRQKLDQLLKEHLQVMADMMEKLDEGRGELNIIVSDKFQEPLPLSKAKFLQVVQRNARLVHENATLRVQIQHLMLNIEKLKSNTQKPKLINVDAKIIAKLTDRNSGKHNKETTKWLPFQLDLDDIENNACVTKSVSCQDSVHYSGDGKLVSKIRSNHSRNDIHTTIREIQTDENGVFRTKRTCSVPEIVQTNVERKCSLCIPKGSLIDFRDASTNT